MPYSLQGFWIGANFHNVNKDVVRWTIGLACLAVLTYAAYLIFAPFFRAIAWALIFTIMLVPVLMALVTGVLDVYRATVRGELGTDDSAAPASGGAVEEAELAAG